MLSMGLDPVEVSYSGFQAVNAHGRDLESVIRDLGVDDLFLCGLATDYCVRATVLDAVRRGLRVHLLVDAVRGVDIKPGDSEAALRELREAGVPFLETRGMAKALPKS